MAYDRRLFPGSAHLASLFRSSVVVSGMTMVSRVLGFARDVALARVFGASPAMDAFLVAFKIPNFLRRLFAEGAFAQAFVPVFSAYKAQDDAAALRELTDRVAGTLGLILFVVSALGVLGAPLLILLFAPGFVDDAAQFALAADLLRITFPYLLFISLTAFVGGMLNAFGRFVVPALTPVLLNICLLLAALVFAPRFAEPVRALAWGVFAAGIAQLLFQLPFIWRLRLLPLPRWGWAHVGVKRILRLMVPTLLGSSVAQINLLLDTLIASFLAAGSLSWLYYSDRLMEFPLGVFGVAVATVILPSLSRRHAGGNAEHFRATLDWALRWMVLIGIPAAAGLAMLAWPILTTLFYSASFQAADVSMSTLSLVAYTLGLPALLLVKVLLPGFYARQDTRTPVRIGIIAMAANMGLNLLFVVPLVQLGFTGPHMGLALATSCSGALQAGLLYRHLRLAGVYRASPGWGRLWLQVGLAVAAMLVALWLLGPARQDWLLMPGVSRGLWLAGLVGGAGVVYGAVLLLAGLRPADLRQQPGSVA